MPIDMTLATDVSDLETKPDKHPGGRPTLCTPELTQRICELVATTSRGLKKLTEENEWMPDMVTIRRWNNSNEEFRNCFSRAKEDQIKTHLQYNIEIVDEAALKVEDENIHQMRVGAVVQAAKLRAETREKYAQLLMPKVYGPKAVIEDEKKEPSLSDQEALAKVIGVFAGAKEREERAAQDAVKNDDGTTDK